mgnify:CR=1 FL=1
MYNVQHSLPQLFISIEHHLVRDATQNRQPQRLFLLPRQQVQKYQLHQQQQQQHR